MQKPHDNALELIARTLTHTYDLPNLPSNIVSYLLYEPHVQALGLDTRGAPEQVFVVEHKGHAPELGLYLHPAVLAALGCGQSALSIDELAGRVMPAALMYATEGVSHVLWLNERLRFGNSVRLLELELQAEVDKFLVALLGSASSMRPNATRVRKHLRALFETAHLDGSLTDEEIDRYRTASQAAERYLRQAMRKGALDTDALVPLLRRFSRQPLESKLRR